MRACCPRWMQVALAFALGASLATCTRGGFDAPARDRSAGAEAGALRDGAGPREGGVDGRPPADLGEACVLVSGCVECEPLAQTGCASSCADGDCDGLPADRDPWPTHCNPVAFADNFTDASLARWNLIHDGKDLEGEISTPACGVLRLTVPANNTYWLWPREDQLAALLPGDVVEVAVRPPPPESGIRLYADASPLSPYVGPTACRECALFHQNGSLRLIATIRAGGGASSGEAVWVDAASPWLVLQSWQSAAQHHCRVVSADRVAEASVTLSEAPPSGSVSLHAINLPATGPDQAFDVDFLRVFRAE